MHVLVCMYVCVCLYVCMCVFVCMCVQVLYTVDLDGKGSIVKRKIPVVDILYDSHFV